MVFYVILEVNRQKNIIMLGVVHIYLKYKLIHYMSILIPMIVLGHTFPSEIHP